MKSILYLMNTIWIVMPILVMLMFLLGMELSKKAFTDIARNPIIAFAAAWALKLPPVYFMGLMLIACCPGGSSSNVFSMLAKGDVALSVTLTALSSVITLFTLPVAKLLMQNLVLVFVPMLAGYIFKYYFPNGTALFSTAARWLFPQSSMLC